MPARKWRTRANAWSRVGQSLFGTQGAHHADHEGIARQIRRPGRVERTEYIQINAVVAKLNPVGRYALFLLQVAPHEIAIHHDGVHQMVRHADQSAITARDQVAMGALA